MTARAIVSPHDPSSVAKVRSTYEQAVEEVAHAFLSFPWTKRACYAEYLAQTFYYVRYSTALLATAAGRFDPITEAKYQKRFSRHVAEEQGHDLLALRDLEGLGDSIQNHPEMDETRMFWEPQFCKIERKHPSAMLGYILILEGAAVKVGHQLHNTVVPLYGEATAFIRVHSEDDIEHIEKALALLDGLDDAKLQHIIENTTQSARALCLMLAAVERKATSQAGTSHLRED